MKQKIEKYILEIIVFICGAAIMVLELIAARVLSPYVGSSNVIWTSIIGVILISMSLGYWYGGKLADKTPKRNLLSNIILLSAILTSFIPILETSVIKQLALLIPNLGIVAILSSLLVFAIPSFLLATISPYAIRLKEVGTENIGKTSGKLSAFSTLGSIVGTFLSGFVLIPNLGVKNIILGLTILLLLLAIFIYENKTKKYYCYVLVCTICILTLLYLGRYIFKQENPDIILDTDSEYSRIWIKKQEINEKTYKMLQVDTGLESYIDEETKKMGAKYLEYYDLFEYFNNEAKNTLLIGGAAYTYPRHYLEKYPNNTIDVVEIDKKMTELAKEYFELQENPRLGIYHQDGRTYLNSCSKKYDAIFVDAFKGLSVPFELTTLEATNKISQALTDNGVVITNILGSLEGKDSKFLKMEYETYKKVFPTVLVYQVAPDIDINKKQNFILVGTKKDKAELEESIEYKELLSNERKISDTLEQYLTDDYAPVE